MKVVIFFIVVLSGAIAAASPPVQLSPFFSAKIIDEQAQVQQSYRLALGAFVKKSNLWQPSQSKWLKGTVSRQTHELPPGFDEQEVFDYYRGQLPDRATILFSCQRRDCGESNNWANDHFRIKQLYGLDQYQFLGVYQVDNQYLTLYTVRRGNRRVYVQIDWVEAL